MILGKFWLLGAATVAVLSLWTVNAAKQKEGGSRLQSPSQVATPGYEDYRKTGSPQPEEYNSETGSQNKSGSDATVTAAGTKQTKENRSEGQGKKSRTKKEYKDTFFGEIAFRDGEPYGWSRKKLGKKPGHDGSAKSDYEYEYVKESNTNKESSSSHSTVKEESLRKSSNETRSKSRNESRSNSRNKSHVRNPNLEQFFRGGAQAARKGQRNVAPQNQSMRRGRDGSTRRRSTRSETTQDYTKRNSSKRPSLTMASSTTGLGNRSGRTNSTKKSQRQSSIKDKRRATESSDNNGEGSDNNSYSYTATVSDNMTGIAELSTPRATSKKNTSTRGGNNKPSESFQSTKKSQKPVIKPTRTTQNPTRSGRSGSRRTQGSTAQASSTLISTGASSLISSAHSNQKSGKRSSRRSNNRPIDSATDNTYSYTSGSQLMTSSLPASTTSGKEDSTYTYSGSDYTDYTGSIITDESANNVGSASESMAGHVGSASQNTSMSGNIGSIASSMAGHVGSASQNTSMSGNIGSIASSHALTKNQLAARKHRL